MNLQEIVFPFRRSEFAPRQVPGTTKYRFDRDDNEQILKWAEQNQRQLTQFIQDHCGSWLQHSRGVLAYRGLVKAERERKPAFVKRVRTDRRPRDSNKKETELYNFLLKVAGSRVNRSNALFVTGSYPDAADYGDPFLVLPMGAVSYTWMKDVPDWASLTAPNYLAPQIIDPERLAQTEKFQLVVSRVKSNPSSTLLSPELIKVLNDRGPVALAREMVRNSDRETAGIVRHDPSIYDPQAVRELMRVDQGLDEALRTGSEIMVRCDQALYLHPLLKEFVTL